MARQPGTPAPARSRGFKVDPSADELAAAAVASNDPYDVNELTGLLGIAASGPSRQSVRSGRERSARSPPLC